MRPLALFAGTVACSLATLCADATGQSAAPAGPQSAATQPATQSPTPATMPTKPRGTTAPLLREGSHVVRVAGRVESNEPSRTWRFRIAPTDPHSPDHAMTLMPCSVLHEVERMVETAGGGEQRFEVTGEVTVFHGHNYLLLTHPPVLIGQTAAPTTSAPSGDSTSEIIRALEQDVGPVARRPASSPPDRWLEEAPDPSADLQREGTLVVGRRGRIRRTGGGAYQFIFDADAQGQADPPMTLLPCLLLERLAAYIDRAGSDRAVIMSGAVTVYKNRNYLRPTVYRIPQERTTLVP